MSPGFESTDLKCSASASLVKLASSCTSGGTTESRLKRALCVQPSWCVWLFAALITLAMLR